MRALLSVLAAWLPAPALACDLALALAVDVSGSVDRHEYRLQMDGLAAALRDPVISEALVTLNARLSLVQWTGSSRQHVAIPWTDIDSFDAVEAIANRIADAPRQWRNYSTAIGDALMFTLATFPAAADCARRLIDVSGDGVSNEGTDPRDTHSALRVAGITVNAIAIEASDTDLTAYYFEHVITGEGAFVVTAATFTDYPDKIRRKLLREVTRQTASNP